MDRAEWLAVGLLVGAFIFAVVTVPGTNVPKSGTHCIQVYRWTLEDGFSDDTLVEGTRWDFSNSTLRIHQPSGFDHRIFDSLSVKDWGKSCE